MNFSLKMEVISAIIIILLILYNSGNGEGGGTKRRWYVACLYLSAAVVCVDVLSVAGIRNTAYVPYWINMGLSSLYYLITCFAAGMIAVYLIYMIFEHSPNNHCLRRFAWIAFGFLALEAVLVAVNCFSGCLFYFHDGRYYQGPLNSIGYFIVLLEAGMVVCCYVRNKKIASESMKMAMRSMPYVIFVVVLFQLFYREMLMNGMMLALSNMIIFISFQSSRIGVDYLTNLRSRGTFVEDLAVLAKKKKRCHIVMISLWKFGQVNRKFGQKSGDEFLYVFARYLDQFSNCSKAYRVGNVEFVLLCPDEECEHVGKCIDEIRKRLEQPWKIGNMEYRLSACFSDILWENEEWDGTQIIEKLEYAMQLSKAEGENHRVCFDAHINEMMERQKYVIEQMNEAISKKSFEIYYQPIYCWKPDLFCSAEALVRLCDRDGKKISPGEFIPIAEETGMILEISWIILEKVCAFLSEHRNTGLKAISVNMSLQQFMEDGMEERLDAIIQRYQVPRGVLKIEITERIITSNTDKVREIMEKLMKKGIGFYLDDFGVGYSNFASVLSLPFDTIKLDKSLTDNVTAPGKKRDFVESIIEMFRDDYSIVAEGAETEETVEALKKLHVDRIQGYYYSRPLPETAFLEFLRKKKG